MSAAGRHFALGDPMSVALPLADFRRLNSTPPRYGAWGGEVVPLSDFGFAWFGAPRSAPALRAAMALRHWIGRIA